MIEVVQAYKRFILISLFWLGSASYSKSLYYPQNIEDLYRGMGGPFVTMGHYGVQMRSRMAFHQQENSGLSFHSAFPLGPRKQNMRSSGWAWGVGGGITDYLNKQDRILAPSIYFWEFMLGRGTNEADLGSNTGLLGFFEVSFRDERPNHMNDQRQVIYDNNRHLPEHRHSFNLRIGASFHPFGEGLVEQHARKISSLLYFHFSLPYKASDWRSNLHFDLLGRANSWLLLAWENSLLASFADKRNDVIDDAKYVYGSGIRADFYLSSRNLLQLGFIWKYFKGSAAHLLSPWPTSSLNYALAF
jgi:hypothetical protein